MSGQMTKKRRIISGTINLAGTILVYVPKLRFSSKYSDVIRSPHKLKKEEL